MRRVTAAVPAALLLALLLPAAGTTALSAQESGEAEGADLPAASAGSGGPEAREGAATSDPGRPHPEAEKAISRLRSPYCPGLMLEICPSAPAAELRDSIQMLAREGWAADSLVEWMLANHGEEWRAMPRAEGTGLWAWLAPPLVLLLGLGVVVVVLRRLRSERSGERAATDALDVTEEDRERLRAAIREMEEREEAGI